MSCANFVFHLPVMIEDLLSRAYQIVMIPSLQCCSYKCISPTQQLTSYLALRMYFLQVYGVVVDDKIIIDAIQPFRMATQVICFPLTHALCETFIAECSQDRL